MPPPSSLDPETDTPEPETRQDTPTAGNPNAPLSFVPHDADGTIPREPVRIRTGRYGEMEEHELVKLLDTIEDERARSRFRESIYISLFIWLTIAWIAAYGPRYLWHAPRIVNPMDVLKEREMTQLNMPRLPPKYTPPPKVDNNTLERLRTMTKEHAARTPEPPKPTATPEPPPVAKVAPMPNNPAPVIPPPTAPTPNVRTPPTAAVPEAPTPAPTKPNFSTPSSATDMIRNAVNNAARNPGAGGAGDYHDRGGSPLKMGGAEILSDTQGVNFNPYLQRILADIKRNWLPLIPEEAQPPLSKQGETYVRFTILPDGNIGVMHLDGSTHDDAINRSCWSAITSEGQFPPLPSQFKGPNLELRIHFLVNKQIE